ncbi:MAG: hypothetical protein JXR10_15555 [Cyclobacteriaceae bacterium]
MDQPIKLVLSFSLIIIACLSTLESRAQSQDTVSYYTITTSDGNILNGRIMQKSPEFVRFKTDNLGEIKIRFMDIESIQPMSNSKGGSYSSSQSDTSVPAYRPGRSKSYDDPKYYLFRNNGFGLEKGDIYYHNVWLFFNEVNFGFSDNFSLGFGVMPFTFDETLPAWIQGKFTLPIQEDKIAVGLGTVHAGLIDGGSNFGMVYTDFTIGNRSNHVNVGVGTGYIDGIWQSKPGFTLSGSIKATQSGALVTENYIFTDYLLYSLVFKQSFNTGVFDYGIFYIHDGFSGVALPWLGISLYVSRDK